MALQASGAISLANIQTEFGGSNPIGLNEYYRDGAYVGAGAPNVPTSGLIDLQDFYGAQAAIILDITSSASEQNILTLATAAGYNASTDSTPIIVNIASGVTISGSSTHALRTGALNANSDLTINITGSVDGFTGATGGTSQTGGVGGDALFFETLTGGTGTYIVNVLSGANLRGGGGGGGGGGRAGRRWQYLGKGGCDGALLTGSSGSNGAAGGFGVAGSNGTAGTYPNNNTQCTHQTITGGGAGGAAGFALRKNSRTVTLNNSGTVAGSAA